MGGLAFTGAPLPASGRVKATKTQSETIRARAKREPRVFPVCRLSECKWGTVPREDQPPAIPRVYNLDWSAELVFEDEPPRRWEAPPPVVPTSQRHGVGRMDAGVDSIVGSMSIPYLALPQKKMVQIDTGKRCDRPSEEEKRVMRRQRRDARYSTDKCSACKSGQANQTAHYGGCMEDPDCPELPSDQSSDQSSDEDCGEERVTTKGKVERKRKRLDLEDDDY